MRKLTVIAICMSVIVCVALFDLKNRVTALDRELQQVRREIVATNQTVHILQAEWAHLNQPDILNQLVSEHTALAPINAEQLVTLADITRESAAAFASADALQQQVQQQANAAEALHVAVVQR
jgi:hypothetical protein